MLEGILGIAIVGAGFGGIGMAIRLKQSGHTDFRLFEQADGIGGTWRDNLYPGCACDIPASLYSYSFATSSAWSRRYPSQGEILTYLRDCVDHSGIRPFLRLGCSLQEATFDPAVSVWRLRLSDGTLVSARVLIVSAGLLSRPKIPDLPGLDRFAGPQFHSARWDYSVDLAGRRVAVIGTGASAIQFIPQIAPKVASLDLYQRTPPWVLPKSDPVSGPAWRFAMRQSALLRHVVRSWTFLRHDMRAIGFVLAPSLMRSVQRRSRSFLKRELKDDALRAAVTPDYQIGCKRILLTSDYLPTLNRPNVSLIAEPVSHMTRDAIVTGDGASRPADVLIFATGFRATEPLARIRILGRNGVPLSETWHDGMAAWLGIAVAGYPNLFLLGGPNIGLGHNSIVFMLETQIKHVLRCLRFMRGRRMIEVRPDAQHAFLAWLRRRMERTVWLSGCGSWYLDHCGNNTTLWPGFAAGYWIKTLVRPEHIYRLG